MRARWRSSNDGAGGSNGVASGMRPIDVARISVVLVYVVIAVESLGIEFFIYAVGIALALVIAARAASRCCRRPDLVFIAW